MEPARRFVFNGHASALGGQLYKVRNKPAALVIEVDGASALGPTGGRSVATIPGREYADVVRFGGGRTRAEGLFDDPKKAFAVGSKGVQDELTSSTRVSAELHDLQIGRDPVVTIGLLRASLSGRSPDGSGEPSVVPDKDTTIEGVKVGDFGLTVTLNLRPFQKYDTRSKLVAAIDDTRQVKLLDRQLLMRGAAGARKSRLRLENRNLIYGTIVREIHWTRKPYPGAEIEGHGVTIPNFGRIVFGEIIITAESRRLTMARFQLGSPDDGYGDGADVGCNGSWA
ncbi:MAG: hypothetical protein HOP14_15255 [Acidobacteria bacterium]|nr:hypothetical protein [Acidobacteriota bacterium]